MTFALAIAAFAALTFILLNIEVIYTYRTQGTHYGWSSNRDPNRTLSALGKRIKNTYSNQVESAAYIVPLLVAAALVIPDHAGAQTAAWLIVIGRLIYSALYYTGIHGARLVGFGLANVSFIYIAANILLALT